MRRITLAAVAIILLGAAAAWFLFADPASDTPPEKYRFAVVDRGRILQNVATTGTLNPVVLVNVGTQISGRIRRVLVDFNQPVRAGELLAELDSSLIEAQIAQLEANFQEMRTQLSVARRKLERSEGLAARGFISAAQVEDERQAVELAQARVRAIEAQVARERTNLAYTAIRSPIDGVVIARSVDVGQTVAASFQTPTLFLIARDLRDMQIDTNVAEADVAQLRLGMQARFRVDALGERSFEATVRQIRLNPKIEQNVVTYNVVLATRNEDGLLLPGMTATVQVEIARRDAALRLPNLALRFRPSNANDVAPAGAAGAAGASTPALGAPAAGPSTATPSSGAPADRAAQATPQPRSRIAEVLVAHDTPGGPPLRRQRVTLGISDGTFTEVIAGSGIAEGDRIAIGEFVQASNASARGGLRFRLF
jgi:HlyD family secretion protein